LAVSRRCELNRPIGSTLISRPVSRIARLMSKAGVAPRPTGVGWRMAGPASCFVEVPVKRRPERPGRPKDGRKRTRWTLRTIFCGCSVFRVATINNASNRSPNWLSSPVVTRQEEQVRNLASTASFASDLCWVVDAPDGADADLQPCSKSNATSKQ
jgi:hypothetical protein